jgi:DNA-binding LacI/PurR family transcriptional regulator
VTIERLLGFEKALREVGIKSEDDYIIHSEFLREGGQEAIRKLINLKNPPTALVVADDLMALGVLNTLIEMNISVPEDISILSFNNVLFSELSQPPLTSVDINIFELGLQASRKLIQLLENPHEPIKRMIIPHQLVKRFSCSKTQ